jgi:DNA-binding GntR family transcriptional regulator
MPLRTESPKPAVRPRAAPRRAAGAKTPVTSAATTADIVARITTAVLEHRLKPGAKLGEEHLGEIFGVSRTLVRQALFQLAKQKLVVLHPGRGAFVAQPTVQEARELFEARRVIERALVWRFTQTATAAQLGQLRAHLKREREALAAGDTAAGTRLSGEFHLRIAAYAGNGVLSELLHDLVSRSSLILLVYGSSLPPSCSVDEHGKLLASIEARNADGALRLMTQHLDHIERGLNLKGGSDSMDDLRAALGPA